MKVLLIKIFVLLMVASNLLQAQDLPYYRTENARPVEEEMEEDGVPKFMVGIKSGPNVSFTRVLNANSGAAITDFENETRLGLNVSAVVFIPFNENTGLAAELGYLIKNKAFSYPGGIDTTVTNANELHHFGTALTYRKYFGAGLASSRGIRSYVAFGAALNFLTQGTFSQSLSSNPATVSLDLTSDYSSVNIDLLVGFGTEIPIARDINLLFELRGGLGVNDFDDNAFSAATKSTVSSAYDFKSDNIAANIGLIIDFK